MVVIAIIGFVVAAVVPNFRTKSMKLKGEIRRLTSLSRQLHNMAKLQNKTYRIAIKMDEERGYSYWVESGDKMVLIAQERDTMLPKEEDEKESDEEKKKAPPFQMDTTIIKGEMGLPPPLIFKEVEISGTNQRFTSGMAYIHYFPYGISDDAAIHISGGESLNWTILVHPLTGQATVLAKDISLEEFVR
jgi:general secretion pathway protein H